MDILILLATALIPLVLGAIWYNKHVFGTAWRNSAGMTEERLRKGNVFVRYGLMFLLCFFVAVILQVSVIHQAHVFSILINEPGFNDPGSEVHKYFTDFMAKYGSNFRTFKHGAFHGTLTGFLLLMPVIGILSLFERRGFKYFAIHTGFWIVSLALMGGVLCAFIKLGE
jgi:hypothetical protein